MSEKSDGGCETKGNGTMDESNLQEFPAHERRELGFIAGNRLEIDKMWLVPERLGGVRHVMFRRGMS